MKGGSDDVENDDNDDKKSTQQHLPDEDVHSPSTNERGYEEVERICLLAKSPIHQMNVAVTVHDESPSVRKEPPTTSEFEIAV